MGTGTVLVHVCNGDVTIWLSFLYDFENFLRTRDESFGRSLHERHTIFVLVHA